MPDDVLPRPKVSAARAIAGSLLLALGGVALVFATIMAGNAWWTEEVPVVERPVPAADGNLLARDRTGMRCDTCGVIEQIGVVEATPGVPATYTFAVRLQDGTLRHSTDPLRGRWQVGDRMMLLGRPAAAP